MQTRRADRLREWKDYVRRLAAEAWTAEHTRAEGRVSMTLLYLYEEAALDADNIIKPIQDALVGVAFDDDSRVCDVRVLRRSLKSAFKLDGVTPILATAFDAAAEFVYVLVEDAPAEDQLL
jgi:crossover junction endodeoxyribonuclease RusA